MSKEEQPLLKGRNLTKLFAINKGFQNIPSVRVIPEGYRLTWAAGADLLIHPGSPPDLESAILRLLSLNLCDHENQWHNPQVWHPDSSVT